MKEKISKISAERSGDGKKKNKGEAEMSGGEATGTEPNAVKHEDKAGITGSEVISPEAGTEVTKSGAGTEKPDDEVRRTDDETGRPEEKVRRPEDESGEDEGKDRKPKSEKKKYEAGTGKSDRKRGAWFEYFSLFWEFFKIGLFTIGGGMAMIPQIQQVAVKDKGWLTEEEMIDCVAISQSMPGVIAINSATYIGKRIKGIGGCLAATLGVIMPSFMIIIIAVTFLGAIGENRYILGAFTGVKAAVCGLIIVTAVRLGKQILSSVFQWVLAIASLLAIGVFGITAIWAILAGAAAGIIYNFIKLRKADDAAAETAGAGNDNGAADDDVSVGDADEMADSDGEVKK